MSLDKASRGVGRRQLLIGGAVAAVGAAAAVGADRLDLGGDEVLVDAHGRETVRFHGAHQPGIAITPQAHQSLVAVQLDPGTGRDDVRRLLSVLTDDARAMMAGKPALADPEPEFARIPARLTVTFGFGPGLVGIVRGAQDVPAWLGPLPAYPIDRLREEWSGGDLLIQVASDDQVTVAPAVRMLVKDTRSFGTVRWHQAGFRRAYGSEKPGTTMRNLLGQVDGTVNPRPGDASFADVVWRDDDWLAGGTTMVVRRIEMLQDDWDRLDRHGRELSVGRTLDVGAPLTGTREHDEPDFDATTPVGFPVIPEFSHIRRARSDDPTQVMFRRGYNYDLGPHGEMASDAGLIFTCFQRDLEHQYLPIQARLAELDLLNQWTVPIGSAVFAIPPGAAEGEFVGEKMFG